MPLSLSKIENLIASKGFVCKSFFTLDDFCIYIEVFSVQNAITFMLYVSSRYELRVSGRDNIYKLNYMEINFDESNIPLAYAHEPDKIDIQGFYNDENLELKDTDVDLEKKLKENYNRTLTLNDLTKDDFQNLKDIFRQLNRFMFCVQNIKYKLTIFSKNYLCSITKDNELDCFLIQNYSFKDTCKLYVYIDLKTLYSSLDAIVFDIKSVRDGINKLLNQNQIKHTKILNNMLEQKTNILQYSEMVYNKKESYTEYINQFELLLEKLNSQEKTLVDKIDTTNKKYTDFSLKGLHQDIERTHVLTQLDKELNEILNTKQEVINNVLDLRAQQENITLKMDKILFDNSIMINEITKNFTKLSEIL